MLNTLCYALAQFFIKLRERLCFKIVTLLFEKIYDGRLSPFVNTAIDDS